MFPRDVVIVSGARTPITRYNGLFAGTTAIDLGAAASRAAISRSGANPSEFDHVIFGNVFQSSSDAAYAARHVGLKSGLPVSTPAVTVNRLCGSGIEAIVQGAHRLLLHEASLVLVGGIENMSQCPHVIRGARTGFRMGDRVLEDTLTAGLFDSYSNCGMSDTAENLAVQCGISRLDSDQYALRSQQAAEQAFQSGKFTEEIVPVEVKDGREMKTVSKDDHRRPSTTLAGLQSLPTAFRGNGMVTAGNSSGITDGAAALVATMERTAKERGWNILGRIVSWATAGVEPRIMGIGPVPASQKALSLAGLKLDQIDLIEVNEAFAPQYLAVEKELGLDRDKTNVNGGAIAIGHPVGATGARLVLTLLLELRRRGARYGLATACIGGGQGIAMIVESVS
jgi:acetyl-CoA acetyltransferase family protein